MLAHIFVANIKAAGVGNSIVDNDDFAMHTVVGQHKVRPTEGI